MCFSSSFYRSPPVGRGGVSGPIIPLPEREGPDASRKGEGKSRRKIGSPTVPRAGREPEGGGNPLKQAFRLLLALILLAGIAGAAPAARAQGAPVRVDVFVDQNATTSAARLHFVDALTGLSTVVEAGNAQQITLLGDYVLYQRRQTGLVMQAFPDGTQRPHPFIRQTGTMQSVQWVTSPDDRAVAWVTRDAAGGSAVYVAWADGSEQRQLPVPSPDPPLRLEPVALTNGMTQFFYNIAAPGDPTRAQPYPVYDHLGAYHIANAARYDLPGEPNCPCGAAFSPDGRIFARLEAPQGAGPFALRVWDLPTDAAIRIPPPSLETPAAGALVINSIGTLAAYSAVTPGGEYVLVLVDIAAQRQTVVLGPGPARYRPRAFIDNDDALLLLAPDGTYKLDLAAGTLWHVSGRGYLGTITTSLLVQ